MLKYIVKRILQMIPMMIILSIVVFCMVRLIPGDPVTMSLGMGAGKEAIAAETARLGLDKPLWQQYFIWVKNLFHGDFGTSISTHKAVLYEIGRRYPNTIKLAIGATIVSTVLGVSFGILAAVKHSKFTDNLLMVVSLISISTPSFFLAMILMLIFCIWLHLLPVSGFDHLAEDALADSDPGYTGSRLYHPHYTFVHAGRSGGRLHPYFPCPWRVGARGRLRARFPQCHHSGFDLCWLAFWLSAGWCYPDGNSIFYCRYRSSDSRRGFPA